MVQCGRRSHGERGPLLRGVEGGRRYPAVSVVPASLLNGADAVTCSNALNWH